VAADAFLLILQQKIFAHVDSSFQALIRYGVDAEKAETAS